MNAAPSEADVRDLAARVGRALHERGLTLATAESCTGGLAAAMVTSIPGSSAWFERGFVTYSNEAKQDMLKVDAGTLAAHGAVSEATVREMAEGAIALSRAGVSFAISGVAGPGGGSAAKPVGLVCLAWAREGAETRARCLRCVGDREQVRRRAVAEALEGVLALVMRSGGKT
jgi:nicotinamide-nucleotide amidase